MSFASQYGGQLVALAVAGIIGGVVLFARGLLAYRSGTRVSGIGTSTIVSAAAGEIRVSGTAEPAAITLVSPLQSRTCLFYRSVVTEDDGREQRTILHRQRAVGFFVKDATGELRVFPAGAAWEMPETFDERTGLMGDEPPGLALNGGAEVQASQLDREEAIASLLTVHAPSELLDSDAVLRSIGPGTGRRHYRETVLEPGSVVTIVGTALPFGQLPDPTGADAAGGPLAALDDPAIAADLEAARESGELAASPEAAWGNAAIPGFGIGRPTRAPVLDPAANPEAVVAPPQDQRTKELFDIAPETLVLATAPGSPMTIYAGTPGEAVDRAEGRFMAGVAGAVLAIVSAIGLALLLTGQG